MNWKELLDRFQFDDHAILDDNIEPVSTIQAQALVSHGQINLPRKRQSADVQFMAEALLVRRLQKTRPEFSVHINGGTNDCLSEFLLL